MAQKRKTVRSKASKRTSKKSAASRKKAPVKKQQSRRLGNLKAQLLERRAAISQGMEQSLDYSDSPPLARGDSSDLAADALDSDTTLQLAERGSTELSQIEEALRKIEDGTYGKCEACGNDIPATRLQALPYATLCVRCKEMQERTGADFGVGSGWGAVAEIEDMEAPE